MQKNVFHFRCNNGENNSCHNNIFFLICAIESDTIFEIVFLLPWALFFIKMENVFFENAKKYVFHFRCNDGEIDGCQNNIFF